MVTFLYGTFANNKCTLSVRINHKKLFFYTLRSGKHTGRRLWYVVVGVSEEYIASIFRVKQSNETSKKKKTLFY